MHVIVHIGPHKTGTTSIQKALQVNRDALRNEGILYFADDVLPARSLAALYSSPRQRAHPEFKHRFEDEDGVLQWSRKVWEGLEAEVASGDADLCILSSEDFSILPDPAPFFAHLRRLFDGITVLAYARAPAPLYLSAIQQNIRGGHCLNRLRTPGSYVYPMRRRLAPFIEAVGAENLLVRNFDRANLPGGDVVADFAAQLARFGKRVTIPSERVNESLPGAAIAWLLAVNETWDRASAIEERTRMMRRLQRSAEVAALPSVRLEDPLSLAILQDRACDDLAWLNATFLAGQVPLDATAARLPEGDIPSDRMQRLAMRDWLMSYLTPEALRAIASATVRVGT